MSPSVPSPTPSEAGWTSASLPPISARSSITSSPSSATPVIRPIWPTATATARPAKKPFRIGRLRKTETTPSRRMRAATHSTPTPSAISAVAVTRSVPAGIAASTGASTPASTVITAASGPTISRRDGPKSA